MLRTAVRGKVLRNDRVPPVQMQLNHHSLEWHLKLKRGTEDIAPGANSRYTKIPPSQHGYQNAHIARIRRKLKCTQHCLL